MNVANNNRFSRNLRKSLTLALLAGYFLLGSPAHAVTDYIFFSVNGDTTSPALTQGDALSWGANCDIGTSIFFEIWYDVNSNSIVDPSTDVLLEVFKITDGVTFDEGDINPIPDGLVQTPAFVVSLHPGPYIFRAENSSDNTTTTRVLVNSLMTSPPNKIKGQITVPGHPAPDNAVLANVWVFAEPETEEAFYAALTNDSGFYEMNIGAINTGDSACVEVEAITGFATPVEQIVVTTGVVSNIDFAYNVSADSVYGFLKDDGGTVITRYSFVGCSQFPSGLGEKEARTESGRFVINFSAAELGDWNLSVFLDDFTPEYIIPNGFPFSHDTLNSFQHDIVLTRADTTLYVKVTESEGLPVNEYAIGVSSEELKSFTRGISGTGSNNVLALNISSLDTNGWSIFVDDFNEDYPIPAGFIVGGGQLFGLSPGDTATVNLIQGKLVTGTLVQDSEDAPIDWSQVQVNLGDFKGFYSSFADPGGTFTVYTDTGTYFMNVYSPGYITNPAWRIVVVSADSTGGLGFTVNETHARVTGTLVNIPTPLSSPDFFVIARTGSSGTDGYEVSVAVDSITGVYQFDLCDGVWTIFPPGGFANATPPTAPVITIGESPDTMRTVDLTYTLSNCCALAGDADGSSSITIGDGVYIVKYIFENGPAPPCCDEGDADGGGEFNIGDAVFLVKFIFQSGPTPTCPNPGGLTCP